MSAAVFIDLETTGLDPHKEEIIEFGIAKVDTATWTVLEKSSGILWTEGIRTRLRANDLDEFVVAMHTKSGLLDVLNSSLEKGIDTRSYRDAELAILNEIKTWGIKGLPVWGSSVHFDRKFLEQKMPELNQHFHYRIVDSSSDMERLKATRPDLWKQIDNDPTKYEPQGNKHRVMEDIYISIDMERRLDKWVYMPAGAVADLPRVE